MKTTMLENNRVKSNQINDSTKDMLSFEMQPVKKSLGAIIKLKCYGIKEKFLELAKEIQCECFPKIFKDDSFLINKLLWAFLFVGFSVLTCYLLTQNVLDYLR